MNRIYTIGGESRKLNNDQLVGGQKKLNIEYLAFKRLG